MRTYARRTGKPLTTVADAVIAGSLGAVILGQAFRGSATRADPESIRPPGRGGYGVVG